MSTLKAVVGPGSDQGDRLVEPTLNVGNAGGILFDQVVEESNAMARYALSNGLEIEPVYVESLCHVEMDVKKNIDENVEKLTQVHQALTKVVSPATPRTIVLLDRERCRKSFFYFLGPVPLVRRLSGAAISFLVVLLSVSLSSEVNVVNINEGLLTLEYLDLFLNQSFLLCCAGLGASFSALFEVNKYIASATYDPRYDSSYWSRLILGLIAGIILVELLPKDLFSEGSTMHSYGKPTLAMFGGFSATVVYRIIQRLVESLETLVKGPQGADSVQRKAVAKAENTAQRAQLNAEVASKLISLQKQIESGDDPNARQKISSLVQELLPGK